MGKKIVLTGTTLTDVDAPKLAVVDLIETVGSLWLVEPMHPANPWGAGVPVHAATVPNVLADFAAETAGIDPGTAGLDIYRTGFTGAQGLLERTARGGVHAIYSPTNATNIGTGSSCGFAIRPLAALRTYLRTNWGHKYYMSMWADITRASLAGKQSNAIMSLARSGGSTTNYKMIVAQAEALPASTPPLLGRRWSTWVAGVGSAGPRIINIARDESYVGAAPANDAEAGELFALILGNAGTINSYTTAKEAVPSLIFYRGYLEDLTVSGRTYAEVDAIDHALYTKEVLTPGGRYYGDTFTDPATIP